jgi:hypothetical protein
MLDVPGVDQPHLEPVRLQHVERRSPITSVASITTRVTPNSRNRSANNSSHRVIVEYVNTSCDRFAPGPGTRTQHSTSALPISNAAIR